MSNEQWMYSFTKRKDIGLVDITIPASHDAGVSDDDYYAYTKLSSTNDTIAQSGNIQKQLEAGSRFFDLRIGRYQNQLHTFHGEGVFGSIGGGWGQSARSIFEQVDEFLEWYDSEIVILRISHTEANLAVHTLLGQVIDKDRLFKCGPNQNLAWVPLSEMKGKCLAIFDSDALPNANPQGGFHRFVKYDENMDTIKGLAICGKYAGIMAGLRKMVRTTLTSGNEHGEHNPFARHDHLFMPYWQLAFNIRQKALAKADKSRPGLTYLDDDGGTHYNLDYLLNTHLGFPSAPVKNDKNQSPISSGARVSTRLKFRPNIINLDFVNKDVCDKIIAFNDTLLPRQ